MPHAEASSTFPNAHLTASMPGAMRAALLRDLDETTANGPNRQVKPPHHPA